MRSGSSRNVGLLWYGLLTGALLGGWLGCTSDNPGRPHRDLGRATADAGAGQMTEASAQPPDIATAAPDLSFAPDVTTPPLGPRRSENFNVAPSKWVGVNNEPQLPACLQVDQDFGYRATTSHAGGSAGEIGGKIWRATTRAYYAMPIPTRTFDDAFSASGKFAVTSSKEGSGLLLGWFNSAPAAGWRNNNSLVFRIDGEKDFFRVYFEYGTQNWSTGKFKIRRDEDPQYDADGTVHTWSLSYAPQGNGGQGSVHFTLDSANWTLDLAPGHKQEGAVFDRFGLWNRQTEAASPIHAFFDDVVLDGTAEDFTAEPAWIGENNQRQYLDCEIEPRHSFGHRQTNHAGGTAPGEMGGLIWRTEWWAFWTAGYYADTSIGQLSLKDRLHAHGRLAMTRTSVDAGLYLGWFNKAKYDDMSQEKAPPDFIGAIVEGPSSEGQKLNACYRTTAGNFEFQKNSPKIVPSGESVAWSIDFDPEASSGHLIVEVDGHRSVLTLPAEHLGEGATFDAFGIGTLRKGGHWVEMFFDDITYTVAQ